MNDDRQLTPEDREKITRLLTSGSLENQKLAFLLIEQTAGTSNLIQIFSNELIVELICLSSSTCPEAMILAGNLALQCPDTWKRFQRAMVNPRYLTCQKVGTMIATNDLNGSRIPTKSFRLEKLGLDGYTLASSAAITKIVKHSFDDDRLDLSGLKFLSESAAKSLSKFRGNIRLDGLKALSQEAAEHLCRHRANLHLDGLTQATMPVLDYLCKHPKLKTNAKLRKKIKKYVADERAKARINSKSGLSKLTKQQAIKIRKLLRAKTPDKTELAVQLIQNVGATTDDIAGVFSTTMISLLVNTWNVKVWNALAPLLKEQAAVRDEFLDLAYKRFCQGEADEKAFLRSLALELSEELYPIILESNILEANPSDWFMREEFETTVKALRTKYKG